MAKGGLRNHYREGMPFFERLTKDLRSWFADQQSRKYHGGRLPVLVTYPDYPSKRTTIAKIARHLHFRLTNKPIKADVVLFFEDQTHKEADLDWLKSQDAAINTSLTDISKNHVETVHQNIFGYGTFIDPTTGSGTAVEKSDANAMHDGHYIELPIQERKPDCIYQKVLNNKTSDGRAVDIRVPVMRDEIPLVYRKYKSWDLRFTNEVVESELLEHLEDAFTEDELVNIRRFCGEMKAEFCELDIIRDNDDGRIYIIDVNPTPYGPPAKLSESAHKKAVHLLATAFQNAFLSNQSS
jgi:hypothetical protein